MSEKPTNADWNWMLYHLCDRARDEEAPSLLICLEPVAAAEAAIREVGANSWGA